jgi:hypothetical protein
MQCVYKKKAIQISNFPLTQLFSIGGYFEAEANKEKIFLGEITTCRITR